MVKLQNILIIFIIITSYSLFSQGFDWQYSARFPSSSPVFFAGLKGGFDYNVHTGDFAFLESADVCCGFNNGEGFGYFFGVQCEYWHKGLWAFNAALLYSGIAGEFSNRKTYERIDIPDLVTEYQFKSNLSYISLDFGAKYRIEHSHFYIGTSLELGYLLSKTFDFKEIIISPPEDYFWPDTGKQERTIDLGTIRNINTILFMPRIKLGYDFTFGLGLYASPAVSFGLPLTSVLGGESWRRYTLSFELAINRGFF